MCDLWRFMFLVIYTGTMSDLSIHQLVFKTSIGRESPKATTVSCIIKLRVSESDWETLFWYRRTR